MQEDHESEKHLLIEADKAIAGLISAVQTKGDWLEALGNARTAQAAIRGRLMTRYGLTTFGVRGAIL